MEIAANTSYGPEVTMKRTTFFVFSLLIAIAAEAQGVEGYVWPLSVRPGETLDLFVSGALMPNDPQQPNITFHRVTSDPAGVLITEPAPTAGISITSTADQRVLSAAPDRDGPRWSLSATFPIPADWPTGYYVATLKALAGPTADYRITFIVKPAATLQHRTAILANINTWNAYNRRYGRFKYNNYPVTSFMRPNPQAAPEVGVLPSALQFGSKHLAHAEVWLLTAIEGFLGRGRVDVYSDLDFHSGAVRAGRHHGEYDRLILSTHPEYWTTEMYDYLRAFLDDGGVVLYLGGNGIFETASYSTTAGGPAMTFLNGQGGAVNDEVADPALRIPVLFRTTVPLRAERALLGVASTSCDLPQTGQPYVVRPHPPVGSYARGIFDAILRGVVEPGDVDRRIGTIGVLGAGASGHEVDRVAKADPFGYVVNDSDGTCGMRTTEPDTTPAGVVPLAEGGPIAGFDPETDKPRLEPGADMIYYPYPNPPGTDVGGGYVFSVGSLNFGQSLLVDPKLRALLGNLLCSGRLAGPRGGSECVGNAR
jgi:hypothetical protein